MKTIEFENNIIDEKSKPFLIAEIGVNHFDIAAKENISPIDAAKKMVENAKESGADAVKFQTYKAEKLASKYSPAYWDTTKERILSQYELFKKFDSFGEDEFRDLAHFCREREIQFLSTPFDFEAADMLDPLMPIFKISSSDITNLPFIQYIARKQKPIFLSTGASTIEEIDKAVKAIEREENNKIVIMHCVLNYPTNFEDANLGMISHLKSKYPEYLIGYSDHTLPDNSMSVLTTAAILGAKVIEKHFTLDKTLPGNDHYHSMNAEDLCKYTRQINFINRLIGASEKKPLITEEKARMYARRSIVANKEISKGTIITNDMLTFKRPGTGISPSEVVKVLGRRAMKTIMEDETIDMNYIRDA